MDISDAKSIQEIAAHQLSPEDRTIPLLNEYLKLGWVLLAIHQRGYKEGHEESYSTAYILGHARENPEHPKRKSSHEMWNQKSG